MTTKHFVFLILTLVISLFLPSVTEGAESPIKKTVLITGASQGIGLATAKEFNERGWSVWAGTRTLTQDLINSEPEIHFRDLNITDQKSVNKLVDEIINEDGRIDALINNAGYGLIGAVESISIDEAKRQFETNFYSVMRLINAVTPWMRIQESGSIINMSSTSGVRAVPGLGMYAASKFALEGYSEVLAVELSPWNINVTIVEPGTVNNSWARHCAMSDNQTGVDSYDVISHKLLGKLITLSSDGQECAEIGELIAQIAENPSPNLRYQTNDQSRNVFSSCLVDPTGNTYRTKWTAFMYELLREPNKE